MSYDMMVFEASAAPREAALSSLVRKADAVERAPRVRRPAVSSAALQAWFAEMAQDFPPLNGPFEQRRCRPREVTEYSIGQQVIYGAFAYSVAKRAHGRVQDLDEKHGVGFFDVSADEAAIVFPDGLVLIAE